jgi:hypothetical protein
MSELEFGGDDGYSDSLFTRAADLIERARSTIAVQANATLTLLYWELGRLINVDVLRRERADYEQQIVATLSRQLTKRFGRGFDRGNPSRMIQFSQVFPDAELVATLSRQLSWSHFHALLPVRTEAARAFYIDQAITARLSVRALRDLIGRQGFERKEIANAQTPATPRS